MSTMVLSAAACVIITPFGMPVVDEVLEPRRMTYEEARGEVMGDFNDWKESSLRRDMLASFRKKFDVDIDEDALEEALEVR